MMNVRHSEDRGRSLSDWLVSRHTLSFGDFDDPDHRRFRRMRVLNDDVIAPGRGFDTHGHEDVEIVSYIVRGRLAHHDSADHSGTLETGEVQRITAGTGITHEEYNDSDDEPLRLVQLWFEPNETGLLPGYEQRAFPRDANPNTFELLVSPSGQNESMTIESDVRLYRAMLEPGRQIPFDLAPGRGAWFHLVAGEARLEDVPVSQGDGVAVDSGGDILVTAETVAEILVVESA